MTTAVSWIAPEGSLSGSAEMAPTSRFAAMHSTSSVNGPAVLELSPASVATTHSV